jgi:hypothetical protein
LLERLQSSLAIKDPVRWNDSGHARIPLGSERDDARGFLTQRLRDLGDDWDEHIAIL